MNTDNKRFENLPLWAQNEITSLKKDNQNLKNKVSELQEEIKEWSGDTKTNTYVSNYVKGFDTPLPKDSTVVFEVNRNKLSVNIKNEGFYISGDYVSHEMLIKPIASNSIFIKFLKK